MGDSCVLLQPGLDTSIGAVRFDMPRVALNHVLGPRRALRGGRAQVSWCGVLGFQTGLTSE